MLTCGVTVTDTAAPGHRVVYVHRDRVGAGVEGGGGLSGVGQGVVFH